MSDAAADFPSFDLREQLTRIDRARAETEKFSSETRKLLAEHDKMQAEHDKLYAERDKMNRDARFLPWQSYLAMFGTVVTALVSAAGLLKLFGVLH